MFIQYVCLHNYYLDSIIISGAFERLRKIFMPDLYLKVCGERIAVFVHTTTTISLRGAYRN